MMLAVALHMAALPIFAQGNFQRPQEVFGTATNDNACTGCVGEYQTAVLAAISATSLVTGVSKTVVSFTLTPGDWDVWGAVGFIPTATTSITLQIAGISLTDNTLPAQDDGTRSDVSNAAFVPGTNLGDRLPVATRRVSVSVNTPVYLIATGVFTVSTLTAYGRIQARRVRRVIRDLLAKLKRQPRPELAFA